MSERGEAIRTPAEKFDKFREIACIIFGALTGFLIASPAATLVAPEAAVYLPPLGAILGGLIGFRRRHNRVFFYFVLVTTLVLSATISASLIPK